MEKIENDNCKDLCDEEYCDDPYTHFEKIKINNMVIVVSLCEKHAKEWEDNYFKKVKEVREEYAGLSITTN